MNSVLYIHRTKEREILSTVFLPRVEKEFMHPFDSEFFQIPGSEVIAVDGDEVALMALKLGISVRECLEEYFEIGKEFPVKGLGGIQRSGVSERALKRKRVTA